MVQYLVQFWPMHVFSIQKVKRTEIPQPGSSKSIHLTGRKTESSWAHILRDGTPKRGKMWHWGKAYLLFSNCRRGHVPHWNLYLRKLLNSVDNCNWHYRRTFPSTQPYSAEEATAREQVNRTMGSSRRQHRREALVTMDTFVLRSAFVHRTSGLL